jgi:hypothetical protein
VVALVTCVGEIFTFRLLWLVTVSKFVPLTVSAVPDTAVPGVKLVMVGAFRDATVNAVALVSEPAGAVTPIVPVVAPEGTVTTSFVAVAVVTVAAVPLNVTVFDDGVAEKPVPLMVTVVATGPVPGENEMMDTCEEAWRSIDSTFPTAS